MSDDTSRAIQTRMSSVERWLTTLADTQADHTARLTRIETKLDAIEAALAAIAARLPGSHAMSDAPVLRLCKDCHWFRPQETGLQPLCGHEAAILHGNPDLVFDQSPSPATVLPCDQARKSWGRLFMTCGPEGRFWEPAAH